jgi:hypothetical protein
MEINSSVTIDENLIQSVELLEKDSDLGRLVRAAIDSHLHFNVKRAGEGYEAWQEGEGSTHYINSTPELVLTNLLQCSGELKVVC